MAKTISSAVPRVDSHGKTGGKLKYISDYQFPNLMYAKTLRSERARARLKSISLPEFPEGYHYIDASDIPEGGRNCVEMIDADWRAFAVDDVRFIGETIAMVVGPDRAEVLRLLEEIKVEYEDLEAATTIEESLALKGGAIWGEDNVFTEYHIEKGNPDDAFARAARVIEDEIRTGVQEHVYIEPQGVVATVENGKLTVYASTQCPFYIRHSVSAALGYEEDDVRIRQTPTGGGFGGKEHYPDVLAVPAAVATLKIGRPVQVVFERVEDMIVTSKRHASRIRLRSALDEEGNILGLDIDAVIDAGAYQSSSRVVLQRCMFTGNGVYDFPAVRVRGRAVATNTVPADAFRGFGAPQGLFAIEAHMSHIARELKIDEDELRMRYWIKRGGTTVTNGTIREDVKLGELLERVKQMSDYDRKNAEYAPGSGRGIALSFVQHGSGFTGSGERDIIKAKVKLRRTAEGEVVIHASNVEIGQGIDTAFRKIAGEVLDIPYGEIQLQNTDTDATPDSGPTCASRSASVVGFLVQEAAKKLKTRWDEEGELEVTQEYAHPSHLNWDPLTLQGDAYPTHAWAVKAVEVELDPVTLEVEVSGIYCAFDIGRAIDELVVEGQIHGGMVQGLGYATIEKMENKDGRFLQTTMADYCIPTSLDFPSGIQSALIDNPYEFGPSGAKGAGEVVLDGGAPALALAVQKALDLPVYQIPLTPEYLSEVRSHARDSVYA